MSSSCVANSIWQVAGGRPQLQHSESRGSRIGSEHCQPVRPCRWKPRGEIPCTNDRSLPPAVIDLWLDIVEAHDLKGKRIHDAHLLATMQANGISRLLTCNPADFPADLGITITTPGS